MDPKDDVSLTESLHTGQVSDESTISQSGASCDAEICGDQQTHTDTRHSAVARVRVRIDVRLIFGVLSRCN
jgi:hypothetical protein